MGDKLYLFCLEIDDKFGLVAAQKVMKRIIGSKRRPWVHDEELQVYRFRNIPRREFIRDKFKKYPHAPGVTLVVGHLVHPVFNASMAEGVRPLETIVKGDGLEVDPPA